MRAIFLILIVAVVALIIALQSGLIGVKQTEPAALPQVRAEGGAIKATGGQTPEFDVQTGSIGVGSRPADVPVPTVKVEQGRRTVNVPAIEVRPAGSKPAEPATKPSR